MKLIEPRTIDSTTVQTACENTKYGFVNLQNYLIFSWKSNLDNDAHPNLRDVRSNAPNKAPVDHDVHYKTLRKLLIVFTNLHIQGFMFP